MWEGALLWCNSQCLSPKFRAKSLHIFTQSPKIVKIVCGIDLLACQDKLFMNNPLDIKENVEHALDFAVHLSHFFRSWWVWTFPSLLCLRVITINPALVTSNSFGQEDCIVAVPLSYLSWNDIMTQIKGCKKSARPPSCVKFWTLTRKMC
jgi:hypothetical protein